MKPLKNTTGRFTPKWFYIFQSPSDERMYLGQTTKSLDKYRGSGKHWIKHLKSRTPILLFSRWCDSPEEFQKLLDIVEIDYQEYWEDTMWFNQQSETPWDNTRLGAKWSAETRDKIKKNKPDQSGSKNPNWRNPVSANKISIKMRNYRKAVGSSKEFLNSKRFTGMKHPKCSCVVCKLEISSNTLTRWHGENCKQNNI